MRSDILRPPAGKVLKVLAEDQTLTAQFPLQAILFGQINVWQAKRLANVGHFSFKMLSKVEDHRLPLIIQLRCRVIITVLPYLLTEQNADFVRP